MQCRPGESRRHSGGPADQTMLYCSSDARIHWPACQQPAHLSRCAASLPANLSARQRWIMLISRGGRRGCCRGCCGGGAGCCCCGPSPDAAAPPAARGCNAPRRGRGAASCCRCRLLLPLLLLVRLQRLGACRQGRWPAGVVDARRQGSHVLVHLAEIIVPIRCSQVTHILSPAPQHTACCCTAAAVAAGASAPAALLPPARRSPPASEHCIAAIPG